MRVPRRTGVRDAFVTTVWCLAFLVLFDLCINILFGPPVDPNREPSELQKYFDYGRSVEGKLRKLIGPTNDKTGPLAFAGWIEPFRSSAGTVAEAVPPLSISVYGMSFSDQVAGAMKQIDPRLTIRTYGGPSAPASHSLAMFLTQRADRSGVVILGILAGSVRALLTTTGITWNFEAPAPYTYPRYYLRNGELEAVWPPVGNLEDFREALGEPSKWQAFLAHLATHDRYFDRLLIARSILDWSALVRMARRAFALRRYASLTAAIDTEDGFTDEAGSILVAITRKFVEEARARGRVPLVLLLQDGSSKRPDSLFRLLGPGLTRDAIRFVSTHEIAPVSDRGNFVADGHFTPEANRRIAQAVLDIIDRDIPDKGQPR